MATKYFVVSLPRSGTTSICKMAKLCGLSPIHAPHRLWESRLLDQTLDFFSDTPVFCPDYIDSVLNTENINPKFIYIERNFDDLFTSWKTVNLFRNYLNMINADVDTMRPSMKFDLDSYATAFGNRMLTESNYQEIFEDHKKTVISLIQRSQKELLLYKFEHGWKPFCDFIGVDIPEEDLPILNKNKMFDKF